MDRKFSITLIYFSIHLEKIHLSGSNLNKVEQRRPPGTSMGKKLDLGINLEKKNIKSSLQRYI